MIFQILDPKDNDEARQFCLKIIKEVYGFDYRPDWHFDLDDLENPIGMYTKDQDGTFIVAKVNNKIVATIGFRSLTTKKNLAERFKN